VVFILHIHVINNIQNNKTGKQEHPRLKPLANLLFLINDLRSRAALSFSLKRHQQLEAAGINKILGSYLKADS
jgi:hypothetical protein